MTRQKSSLICAVCVWLAIDNCGGKQESPAEPATGTPSVAGSQSAAPASNGSQPNHEPNGETSTAMAADTGAVAQPMSRPSGVTTVFDWLDSRFMVHLYKQGGLFVPAGDAGFLKYIQGGWKSTFVPGKSLDNLPVAFTKGLQGQIRFPFDPALCEGPCQVRFRLKPTVAGQRVSIFVNEVEHPAKEIRDGTFADYELNIKDRALVSGENNIRFHFRNAGDFSGLKTAAAFAWIWIGAQSAVPLTVKDGQIGRVYKIAMGGKAQDALPLGFNRVAAYLTVPAEAKLALDLGSSKPQTAFQVRVTEDIEGKSDLLLNVTPPTGQWVTQVVDLGAFANKPIRIELVATGPADAEGGWARPQVVMPAAKIAKIDKRPKNVVIWVSDTLRWDRVKAYNAKTRVKTPNFDAFIPQGVMFRHHTVSGGHSIPSHSSLLSGEYPAMHGHRTETTMIKPSTLLVEEVLQSKGFTTGIISANGYVSDKWGFNQGWNTYLNLIRDKPPSESAYLVKHAEQWLDQNSSKPFFLYLVTIDPHITYEWRDDYAKQYDDKTPYQGPFDKRVTGMALEGIKTGKLVLTARDKARMEAAYDGEVTYNDYYFKVFLDMLQKRGLDKDTLVVVTSDHGDEFFEHGSCGHGHSVYNELIETPFFMALPGVLPSGREVAVNVEIVDLAPTLLDILGIETPDSMQGSSLLPLMLADKDGPPRPAFAEQGEAMVSSQIGMWKYILKQGDNAQLYDLLTDPYEHKDLRTQHPIIDRMMRDTLALWLAYNGRWNKSQWGLPNSQAAGFVKAIAAP